MSALSEPVHRTAWLYTRRDEAIRLEVQDADGRMRLQIFGPGDAYGAFEFPDERALLDYQATYERGLLDTGFSLRITSDRRSAVGNAAPWDGVERRRR